MSGHLSSKPFYVPYYVPYYVPCYVPYYVSITLLCAVLCAGYVPYYVSIAISASISNKIIISARFEPKTPFFFEKGCTKPVYSQLCTPKNTHIWSADTVS
jgi:hypothetical protein